MEQLINLIRGYAEQTAYGLAQPRLAIVTSLDTTKYVVRVRVQPENALSGWLPLLSLWLGNGWGVACPPAPGDQVLVIWQEGDPENGVVIGRVPSAKAVPPPAKCGELWITHASGAGLRLQNDGNIASTAQTWTHTGDLHVTGDVRDRHGTLAGLRDHYNAHVHPPGSEKPSPVD